jgi:CO/xanthine dehydrogenase Mo-binding subunit
MTFLLRRPVRLAYSRREVFDATPKRHPYDMHFRVGARRDGHLTGIRVRTTCNTGGYDSAGYWIANYAVTASGGAYVWQAVDAWAQSVYTNAPKAGQFRGFGTPQSTFAIECTLDELAQTLDVDPLELRLANRLHPGSISFLGYPVAESLGYAEVLEALRPRYTEWQAEAAAFNAQPSSGSLCMGVGLAGMWYRFGKSGSLRIETHAELARDGHVIFYCSAPDYGQGINTVMLQLAAETLRFPRERLELVNADTALTPDSGIQGASRATYFIGSSLCNAAENLQREILSMAAEMMDADPAGLTLQVDGVVGAEPAKRLPLADIAGEFDRVGKSRKVLGLFDLTPFFPDETRPEYIPLIITGGQVAQVVVDRETGQVEVKKVVAAHDVGHAINPPNAIGQIQGAVVMGVGSALYEAYVPGVSTGFTDYILPMISAVPEIETILVEVPSLHGPLGAKGLGEAAMLPTAPAIINAVSRAIGVRLREIPATPPRVRQAILRQKS